VLRGDKMFKNEKFVEWDEFRVLDSEAQFWDLVNNDPSNCFKNMGMVA